MALTAAEEETIETLKKWWDQNGNKLLATIAVVLAAYGGWNFWQSSQASSSEQASDIYETILQSAIPEAGEELGDAERSQIARSVIQLKDEHSSSIYAQYAALFAAQKAVEAGDLAEAENELQWIIDNQQGGLFGDADEGLLLIATLRQGRVILARGDAERALTLVNSVDPKSFEAGYAELRGDIYASMGRLEEAGDAYRAAQQAGASSNTLQMKLDNALR